jgi:glucose/arabinose dehydrogenase
VSKSNTIKRFLAISMPLVLFLIAACSAPETPPPFDTPTLTPFTAPTSLPSSEVLTATLQPTDMAAPTPAAGNATDFPDPAGYNWSEVISDLDRPIGLTSADDGSRRLFIIEQRGRILIYDGEGLLDTPFLDIQGRVGSNGSEQGLLGLAFHPDYESNGFFFVNYTDNNGDTVVSRFVVSSNPDLGAGDSESRVLNFDQPFKNHNGGQISFGPQGYLWIASGDGGSGGDPQDNAQNLDSLLGKLLRVDVNQQPYTVPAENPFGNEVWAYGLRNPWRFSFDPANGDLYIADVGQNKWEEIHYLAADAPAGANFGWDYLEGSHSFEGSPPGELELIDPIWEYDHSLGCSVSGGAVYRGSLLEWQGIYLYSDFCSGLVWGLLQTPSGEWQNQQLFSVGGRIAAIDQDEDGEVYLVDLDGSIFKLTPQ